MTKLPVAAGLALALVAGSALAADLPSHKAPPAYIPPPPTFTWTGLYGGVNIGYSFNAGGAGWGYFADPLLLSGATWTANPSAQGVIGGGQIGYNYQYSPWLVIGAEADIQAADINSQQNNWMPSNWFGGLAALNTNKYVDWFGTVRGRLGLVMPSYPNLMVYGTAGFAYGYVSNTVSVANYPFAAFPVPFAQTGQTTSGNTNTGWTAGGGVEWTPMAFPAWSLKVEYLYTDLGVTNQSFFSVFTNTATNFTAANQSPTRFHTVRAGLNWHFNPFASAPVLAKY
ncbi:outer membrane protein [Methylocystis sp. ATCC 49242]|uniref:outer membrane protein n=1 Tax=Methylocystis sp. ATCC 49242 TaxID=622637 RepID=UPI0001F877B2|nr:outer membrane beta-barrel protein [Methylocystis sp. ATCC 49242]